MNSTDSKKQAYSPMRNGSRKVLVQIKTQDGNVTRIGVRSDKTCERVFRDFCKKKDLHYRSIVFVNSEGHRITKHKRTLEEAGFEDEVEIDAMEPMGGGGGRI